MAAGDNGGEKSDIEEQEEALVALIEHRTKEVQHLRTRLAYYKLELDESEKKLEETQRKLARIRNRDRDRTLPISRYTENGIKVKEEDLTCNPNEEDCKITKTERKPLLVIPAVNPKQQAAASQTRGIKRKFEENEHKDLIEMVSSSSSSCKINCESSNFISSQHNRKLRCLVLCPTDDQLFVTSALDGMVNLWQIQDRGSCANLVSAINVASLKQRKWPEDVVWHPNKSSLISVYSADSGDSQISILNLNKRKEKTEVTFLEDKPHVKGNINNVVFAPWDENCFITGGSDHAVVYWTEKNEENLWKPKILHKKMHSSAVMGVAGMHQKQIVISVGADKRIIGFNLSTEKTDYKHQIDSKCMRVLPNPCDFNLFMVQTGIHERQLRLFDIRTKGTEIHEFGWKQESSTSQSALINQCWSPNGLYLTSGSADPIIHIFDIRFNSKKPSQSIKAHQNRVFKAAWHHSMPLLISISSDLNIGLHNIT